MENMINDIPYKEINLLYSEHYLLFVDIFNFKEKKKKILKTTKKKNKFQGNFTQN